MKKTILLSEIPSVRHRSHVYLRVRGQNWARMGRAASQDHVGQSIRSGHGMLFWNLLSIFTLCSRALGWWCLLAWEMFLFWFRELLWCLADLNHWKAAFSLKLSRACTFWRRGLCSPEAAAARAARGIALTTVATGFYPGFVPSTPSPLLRVPHAARTPFAEKIQRFKTSQKRLHLSLPIYSSLRVLYEEGLFLILWILVCRGKRRRPIR